MRRMPWSYSRKARAVSVVLIILAALALTAWRITRPANPLLHTYRNATYGFSLRLPADYAVTESPNTNPPGENSVLDIIEFEDAGGS